MNCEVFFWIDSSFGQTEQSVIHFYLDKELNMKNNVDESKTEIKDSMFINGTELNEQYFQYEFKNDLQFLEILKTELYIREHNP